jgi:spermidine synthase
MLKKFPTRLTESEFHDSRVKIINTDARFFLRSAFRRYDTVLIGMSNQDVLSTNRLFTEEFFSLIKLRLNANGVIAIWLPGSLTYLSKELINLNYSILNGLKEDFEFVRIIPGDYNIFIASADKGISQADANLISKRLTGRAIETSLLKPSYLNYRLSEYWLDWFEKESSGATMKINKDMFPVAVFESLILWNKKFSPKIKPVLEFFGGINLGWIIIFTILGALLLFFTPGRFKERIIIPYSIATTGFFAMLANLVLIFSFQVFYGYLYHKIGLLISIFMAGIASGSIIMAKKLKTLKNGFRLFLLIELLIIVFTYCLALILNEFIWFQQYSSAIFIALFFISGILAGLEFPLAAKVYLKDTAKVGEVSGILYSADLIGGWLAGIIGGVVLLPVLGVFNTCLVIIVFKASSLMLIACSKKRLTSNAI